MIKQSFDKSRSCNFSNIVYYKSRAGVNYLIELQRIVYYSTWLRLYKFLQSQAVKCIKM